jgi:hypothetical protein
MNTSTLPENNTKVNIKLFLLDPLSVIIKLAILSNKPIGTKLLIQNNLVYFQEPGWFQSATRYFYNTNKTDLQYMYNPIQIACATFLSKESVQKTPRIKSLFVCAQNGLKNLIETYKTCSILTLCLNYYYAIITNYVDQKFNDSIFYKDTMTSLYTKEIIDQLNEQWSTEKIKVILDLISFLTNDSMAANNVKSLETIMENNDVNSQKFLSNI